MSTKSQVLENRYANIVLTFIFPFCIQIERHWSHNLSWIRSISLVAWRLEYTKPHSRHEKLFFVGSGTSSDMLARFIGDVGGDKGGWPTDPIGWTLGGGRVETVIGFDIATAFEIYSCFGMIIRWLWLLIGLRLGKIQWKKIKNFGKFSN